MSEISNIEKEYKYLKELIKNVYLDYSFIDESLEFHYPHIINILELDIEQIYSVKESSRKDYLKEKVHSYFIDWVRDEINNPVATQWIIESYIKCNLKYRKQYLDLIKELEKLDAFFTKFEYIPSPDLCIELINKNKIVKQIMDEVVSKKMGDIQTTSLDSIFNNSTIELLVETYCVVHGIKVVDEADDDINLDSFNYTQESVRYTDLSSEKMFFQEIRRVPLLTPEEERELLIKYVETKSRRIRDILVERNMRLVVKIASKYVNKGLDFMDLIQEGSIGLVEAIDKFDINRGTKLSTYATFWIRQTIARSVADKGRNIRLPVHIAERVASYERTLDRLSKELNRQPTLQEIAKAMNTTPRALENLIQNTKNTFSINTLVGDDNDTELGDLLVDDATRFEDAIDKKDLSEQVMLLFKKVKLTDREIDVIIRRFGLHGRPKQSLESIGKIHHVSRERIRQIEKKALGKLGRTTYIKPFAAYADDPDKVTKKRPRQSQNREESENNMPKELVPLADLLNRGGASYTNEQIMEMISKLSDEERGLLTLRYTEGAKLNSDQTSRFYGTLLPKMKRRLENPDKVFKPRKKRSTIVNVEQSENVVHDETHDIQPITDVVNKEASDDITPVPIVSDDKNISREEYEKMLELLRTPTFSSMMDQFSPKEAIIISLKLGYVDGKYFSTSSIAGFLDIEEQEVIDTTKKALLMYQDSFVNFIDVAIQETSGGPVKKLGVHPLEVK